MADVSQDNQDPSGTTASGPGVKLPGGNPIGISAIVLIVVIIVGGYFLLQSSDVDLTPQQDVETESTTLTGLHVAARIIGFLDQEAYLGGGKLLRGFNCSISIRDGCEEAHNEESILYGNVSLGFLRYAEATGEQTYRDRSQAVVDDLLNRCEEDLDSCLANFTAFYEYYTDTGEDKYLDAMERAAPLLLRDETYTLQDRLIGDFGTKLWMMYDVTDDEVYRDKLVGYANTGLLGIINNNTPVLYTTAAGYDVNRPGPAVARTLYIPAYRATGNESYLRAAQDFFSQAELHRHISDEEPYLNSSNALSAAEGLFELAELVPTASVAATYRQHARSIVEDLLQDRGDFEENIKYNGDGGFLSDHTNVDPNEKRTVTNGWLLEMVLKLPDANFTLTKVVQ